MDDPRSPPEPHTATRLWLPPFSAFGSRKSGPFGLCRRFQGQLRLSAEQPIQLQLPRAAAELLPLQSSLVGTLQLPTLGVYANPKTNRLFATGCMCSSEQARGHLGFCLVGGSEPGHVICVS